MKEEEDYKPFGEEWKKEMSKLTKSDLIEQLKKQCVLNIINMTFEDFIEKHHSEHLSDYVRYEQMILWVDEYNDYLEKEKDRQQRTNIMKLDLKLHLDDYPFCPYCGRKREYIVSTDINSGRICKNPLCGWK